MSKYIVKNCPNCNAFDNYQCEISTGGIYFSNPCKDSDCIIKQAIKKLRLIKRGITIDLINETLNLFEIEEIEEA